MPALGPCSAAQPSCRGGASPTMQFFKSSLILLFASRVLLCHGGDLGLAQGSALILSEEGLQEVARFPFQPPCLPTSHPSAISGNQWHVDTWEPH